MKILPIAATVIFLIGLGKVILFGLENASKVEEIISGMLPVMIVLGGIGMFLYFATKVKLV